MIILMPPLAVESMVSRLGTRDSSDASANAKIIMYYIWICTGFPATRYLNIRPDTGHSEVKRRISRLGARESSDASTNAKIIMYYI